MCFARVILETKSNVEAKDQKDDEISINNRKLNGRGSNRMKAKEKDEAISIINRGQVEWKKNGNGYKRIYKN